MMRSFISGYQAVQLVGVSEATWSEDTGLRAQLNIKSGYFPPAGFVLLGSELATKLRVDVGSLVTILVLAEGSLEPYALTLEVSGLFSSGYYTFDANLAILNLDYMRELLGSDRSIFTRLN